MNTLAERAVSAVSSRMGRRGFLGRSAVVGSALAVAPAEFVLRPTSAYAAVCGCSGQSCACGSQCCDGYTEFCCTIYGTNACPPDTVAGGWWKVDGSGYCYGQARYYIDCHRRCGSCGCGSSGLCSGACANTSCGCANGSCGNRKSGCTQFRYGNCNNGIRCLGPIVCRLVTFSKPWEVEPSCISGAVRVDNNTRNHNRPCIQSGNENPLAGDWGGDAREGLGFYFRTGDGAWRLRGVATSGSSTISFPYGSGDDDVPVVGDWNGNGVDGIGVYRNATGQWLLRDTASGGSPTRVISYGSRRGDVPVVGDWNGSGRDGIGVYRNDLGQWLLRDTPTSGQPSRIFNFGSRPGDVPVVGDWDGDGVDGIGIYRPSQGRWYLRNSVHDQTNTIVDYGPVWYTG
jgi:hypothetical protein